MVPRVGHAQQSCGRVVKRASLFDQLSQIGHVSVAVVDSEVAPAFPSLGHYILREMPSYP